MMAPQVWRPPAPGQESGQEGATGGGGAPCPRLLSLSPGVLAQAIWSPGSAPCPLWVGVIPSPSVSPGDSVIAGNLQPHQELLCPGAARCRPCLRQGVGDVIVGSGSSGQGLPALGPGVGDPL